MSATAAAAAAAVDEDEDGSSSASSDYGDGAHAFCSATAFAGDSKPVASASCSAASFAALGCRSVLPSSCGRAATAAAADAAGWEVDFDIFLGQYWPKFDTRLKQGLDPSMVFAEIQSCIKGSEGSLASAEGRLSKQQYLALAERRCCNLTDNQRLAVYKVFTRYESLMAARCHYDALDLTHHVWRQLQQHGFDGPVMEYVYVDEAQDLCMAQLGLLTLLCKAPPQAWS
ncbi:hypothetical protein COO60DRAFT_91701 [Scenedesmus sp. NREL 46B-D3]|nr:hypothetical protein COO60DRAFT_91701 [Scenedesmus sp. NREL 46B-D3]